MSSKNQRLKSVLILGAGVTRAAAGRTAMKNCPPLDADYFKIARLNAKSQTKSIQDDLFDHVGEYSDILCQSLESATSYIYLKTLDANKNDRINKTFVGHLLLLQEVLARTTNQLSVHPRSLIYRFLLNELAHVEKPEDMTIVTFNYDILLERALRSLADTRPGVFSFPGCYRLKDLTSSDARSVTGESDLATKDLAATGVPVLKLHGSLNWFSKHKSFTPLPRHLTAQNRQLTVSMANKIPKALTFTNKRTVHLKPIIIPPVSGKRAIMQNDVLGLWKIAAKALQQADRIVIAGYSCPPMDLEARFLISENLRKNDSKNVYLVNPDAGIAARFLRLCGVDHSTIYTSLNKFVDEDPIRNPR